MTFTYSVPTASAPPADGITFGFQNQNLAALGTNGGGLGYTGITPSAVAQINIFPNNTAGGVGSGVGVITGGQTPPSGVTATGAVNAGTTTPTNVTYTWDGTNADIKLVQGANTFDSGPIPLNIAAQFPGGVAFLGFTGGTGGSTAQQQIANLVFTSPSQNVYPNAVNLNTPTGTILVQANSVVSSVTMGPLSMSAGGTLNAAPDPSTPANQAYGLGFTSTTLNGANTFNMANNGTGAATLNLGVLNNGPGTGSITVTGGANTVIVGGGSILGNLALGSSSLIVQGNTALGSLTAANSTTISNGTANNVSLTIGGNNADTTYGGTVLDGGTGKLAIVKNGTGTLSLTGTANTYTGGTVINNGIVSAASDGSLGTGPVTIGVFGTLNYSATTATAKSFNNSAGGTLAAGQGAVVTLNGSQITGGYLSGAGTFATSAATGAQFANVTTLPSVTIASNSGSDLFTNVTNGGTLNIAANLNQATPVNLNNLYNQGSGSITIGANTFVNAANFQSDGVLTLSPGTGGNASQLTNTGSSPMFFNTGSRTFLSIPAHAGLFDAGIDLHGSNAVVAGGLFVNNGYVVDSVGAGTKTVIADYGSLVKGAGFYQNSVQTVNGGKFQSGNSPGTSSFGTFTFGPGGVTNYQWQINDPGPSPTFSSAPGIAGGTSSVTGSPDFGWSLIKAIKVGPSPGNFTWTATAASPLTVILQTLTGQTTVGNDVLGPMQNFDPTHAYSWQFVTWAGNYTGPTDAATLNSETIFDQSSGPFANTIPAQATFGWSVKFNSGTSGPGELDLTYSPSPIPEPGTLALTGLAGLGLGWIARRRRNKAA
jgi:autotransporter-associated beta strand protein